MLWLYFNQTNAITLYSRLELESRTYNKPGLDINVAVVEYYSLIGHIQTAFQTLRVGWRRNNAFVG